METFLYSCKICQTPFTEQYPLQQHICDHGMNDWPTWVNILDSSVDSCELCMFTNPGSGELLRGHWRAAHNGRPETTDVDRMLSAWRTHESALFSVDTTQSTGNASDFRNMILHASTSSGKSSEEPTEEIHSQTGLSRTAARPIVQSQSQIKAKSSNTTSRITAGYTPSRCGKCNTYFENMISRNEHELGCKGISVIPTTSRYSCGNCNFGYPDKTSRDDHECECFESPRFQSDFENEIRARNEARYTKAQETVQPSCVTLPQTPLQVSCHFCNQQFEFQTVRSHMESCHLKEFSESILYFCSICGQPCSHVAELEKHAGENHFHKNSCWKCKADFVNLQTLAYHSKRCRVRPPFKKSRKKRTTSCSAPRTFSSTLYKAHSLNSPRVHAMTPASVYAYASIPTQNLSKTATTSTIGTDTNQHTSASFYGANQRERSWTFPMCDVVSTAEQWDQTIQTRRNSGFGTIHSTMNERKPQNPAYNNSVFWDRSRRYHTCPKCQLHFYDSGQYRTHLENCGAFSR